MILQYFFGILSNMLSPDSWKIRLNNASIFCIRLWIKTCIRIVVPSTIRHWQGHVCSRAEIFRFIFYLFFFLRRLPRVCAFVRELFQKELTYFFSLTLFLSYFALYFNSRQLWQAVCCCCCCYFSFASPSKQDAPVRAALLAEQNISTTKNEFIMHKLSVISLAFRTVQENGVHEKRKESIAEAPKLGYGTAVKNIAGTKWKKTFARA